MRIHAQQGFTLVEIIVATALFVLTVSLIMGLFNYTLQTNRKVQSIRAAVQGTRNFTETLAREIRNGRVYYKEGAATTNPCGAAVTSNYNSSSKTAVALTTASGDLLCFSMREDEVNSSKGRLFIKKYNNAATTEQEITSDNFWVNSETFRLEVNPSTPPTSNKSSQPKVTIFAEFISQLGVGDQKIIIPYQTTISTDVYDIPAKTQ